MPVDLTADELAMSTEDFWNAQFPNDATNKDAKRQDIRDLQDEILEAVTESGMGHLSRLSNSMPDTVTVDSLRTVIFPEYETELRNVLRNLTH